MEDYLSNTWIYFMDRVLILFTTYICSMLIFIRFMDVKLNTQKRIYVTLASLVLPILCQVLGGISNLYIKLIFLLLIIMSLVFVVRKEKYSAIPGAIISVAVSLCAEYMSLFLTGVLFYYLNYSQGKLLTTICSCLLQLVFCIGVSSIKRIKKGFNYISQDNNFGIGLLSSSYILAFCFLLTKAKDLGTLRGLLLFTICPLILSGLILWIRNIVKRYYKNKLQDRENKYTKQEIEDKDKRIERLEAEITTLAKQVHRDNHLMTSVDRSVQELAECDSAEQREQIVGEIHTLYLERNDSIAKEQQKNKILPSTGFALIDSSLSELYVKAAARGINFDLTVGEEPYYLVNNIISQTDLQTLLCDHIKDAIIAVESAGITDGRILVTIEKKDSIYEIAIRDNGVDFDVDTLARIGMEQVTTHADDGGSGIGFMTTFETLHKTKGSLIITEYEQKTPFSKSVAFVFDGLNRFIISSYRKEELENTLRRDDVIIIGQ